MKPMARLMGPICRVRYDLAIACGTATCAEPVSELEQN
jgi:hypothetical protein